MTILCETSDLLVFSHLRWDFMYQRPHHILSRYAKYRRVFYVEEPVFGTTEVPRLHLKETPENVLIVVPHLPSNLDQEKIEACLSELIEELIYEEEIIDYTLWYYTPKARAFTRQLEPLATIFDYTDSLPRVMNMEDWESEMMEKSDIVFTSGLSLYSAKKTSHQNIYPFPSSIDYAHFSQGRMKLVEPDDQINIPRPRVGFYGVIDERFDFNLLVKMAEEKPELQFVILGPHERIDASSFPKRNNIHYLGKKDYHALPLYLAGWECTIMPFMMDESTHLSSPSKTSEFLAAGKPVVSTMIQDVKSPFGAKNLVHVAEDADSFIKALETALSQKKDLEWLDRVDHFLKDQSWDQTFEKMARLESESLRQATNHPKPHFIHPITLSASGAI